MASLAELARSIFGQAMQDCSIERAFKRMLCVTEVCGTARLILDGEEVFALDRLKRLRVLAAGKAASAMLDGLLARLPLPRRCELKGVLIGMDRPETLRAGIEFFSGGHPVPNEASFAGASAALHMLHALADASTADSDTLCIFLISGGASAMMELPLDSTISLEDAQVFHQALVHSGASIVEMNCVRKHFSAVKGGRLALAAGSIAKISLLVSDVPSARLDALGSGPTVADPTTVAECRDVLAKYRLMDRLPASVRRFFQSVDLPETPKPGEITSPIAKLLNGDDLAEAARISAARLGFYCVIDNTCDDWSYDAAADYLLDRLRLLRRQHPRLCLISTGEVTVRLPAHHADNQSSRSADARRPPARGGRNQHFALYTATLLRPSDGPIAIFSAGSDGIDGNSSAAGAIIDERTLDDNSLPGKSAIARRASALQALQDFDSSSWLARAGATVVTGPTGNNLRDLRILLADTGP